MALDTPHPTRSSMKCCCPASIVWCLLNTALIIWMWLPNCAAADLKIFCPFTGSDRCWGMCWVWKFVSSQRFWVWTGFLAWTHSTLYSIWFFFPLRGSCQAIQLGCVSHPPSLRCAVSCTRTYNLVCGDCRPICWADGQKNGKYCQVWHSVCKSGDVPLLEQVKGVSLFWHLSTLRLGVIGRQERIHAKQVCWGKWRVKHTPGCSPAG